MRGFTKGRYTARRAENPADIAAAQALRHLAFRKFPGCDSDRFDPFCQHIVIEEVAGGRLVACFRLLKLECGAQISQSYSAQFYDLSPLEAFRAPMAEMGRFCLHPDVHDPDILRVAWGALTRIVDEEGVEMLFGCSSFDGIRADVYGDTFAWITERHLAPKRWLPKVKAPNVFRFAQALRRTADARRAMQAMPPLLRTYLVMGGWVSDHAVVDADMNTLHVFTGLEIKSVPPARARLLRAVAG